MCLGHAEALHRASIKYLADQVDMKEFNKTGRQPCQQTGKFVSETAACVSCNHGDR